MATVTKPLITNETGLAIVEAIENISISGGGVKFVFVSALPATGEEGTFYFVSNGSSTGSNLYDEYIWDKTNSRFELISSNIQIDSTPTQGSQNPVASGGVYTMRQQVEGNIAPIENSTTASQSYDEGDHFYLNGVLYKATAAIASGGSIITSGTGANVEATVLVDDLGAGGSSITTTTTDPGEGSALPTNDLLIVVEE